jgi:hypothetical protein
MPQVATDGLRLHVGTQNSIAQRSPSILQEPCHHSIAFDYSSLYGCFASFATHVNIRAVIEK